MYTKHRRTDVKRYGERQTFTSSAVKQRYNKKTYQTFVLRFRKDTDADIIDYIKEQREEGIPVTEIARVLIRQEIER